jgi:retron-type reverse transcriptase
MNTAITTERAWDEIISMQVLNSAWKHVRERKAGPGSDRQTVAMFAARAQYHLEVLRAELLGGSYAPRATLRIRLKHDPDRPICVASVRDRVVQRAMTEVLGPHFNRQFADTSFAYRSGWSIDRARRQIDQIMRSPAFAAGAFARMDIRKFFDTIDRHRLSRMLGQAGLCARTIGLVEAIMTAGVLDDGWRDTGRGIPQGGALSPLLSNIYLHRLDTYADAIGVEWFRYADDIVLLAPKADILVESVHRIRDEMIRMGLDSNDAKLVFGPVAAGFDFIGLRFTQAERRLSIAAWRALESALIVPTDDTFAGTPTEDVESLELETAPVRTEGDGAALMSASWKEWHRWYGRVELEEAMTPEVVHVLLLTADPRGQVHALAQRRCVLSSTSRPVASAGLGAAASRARAWLALGTEFKEVALLELADALRVRQVGLRDVVQTCDALGVRYPRVWRQGDGVADWLDWVERLDWGSEACRAIRGRWRAASVLGTSGDEERLATLLRAFGADGAHMVERRQADGYVEMVVDEHALSSRRLLMHFNGGARAGVFVHDAAFGVRCIGFRVLGDRKQVPPPWSRAGASEEARAVWEKHVVDVHAVARALMKTMTAMMLPVWMEDDGQGVRILRVLLRDSVDIAAASMVLRRVQDELMVVPEAVRVVPFPGSAHRSRGRGAWLFLPLGTHPRSGIQGRVVDVDGRDRDLDWRDLARMPRAEPEVFSALVDGRIRPLEQAILPGIDEATGAEVETGRGELDKVLAGCGVLRAWYWKAQRLGHLDPMEKQTCYEVLGHLPKSVRMDALVAMLERCGVDRGEVQRRLVRLPSMPIACRTVRSRFAVSGLEAACGECRFAGLPRGAYATPVLHAVDPSEVPGLVELVDKLSRKRRRGKAGEHPGGGDERRGAAPAAGRRSAGKSGKGEAVDVGLDRSPGEAKMVQENRQAGVEVTEQHGARSPAQEFEQALEKVRRLREASANAARGLERAEAQLNELFDRHGSETVELPQGRLVRRSTAPPQFALELCRVVAKSFLISSRCCK